MKFLRAALLFFAVILTSPALSSETVTYSYDALGRLVATVHTGGAADGLSVSTGYDPAGNRSTQATTGAPLANLAISDASVTEGGNLVFTVTRSGNTATLASVNWATSGGTATSGSDFTAGSGTLNFAAGQTTATITVATIDDVTVESAEALTVALSSPSSGATITTATGTGTINDNDVAPANLAIADTSVTEGGNLVFTVARSGNTATAASVNWATAGGTATSGSDFTAGSSTLNFAAGQTTATITVATIDDVTVESAEAMTVALSSPSSGATITTAAGTGTINDNDVAPANLAIAGTSVTEGGNLVFTVTRSGNTATAVSVSWATAGGTAISGSDFTAGSGTLNFAASQTTATITVATIDDATVESAEAMTVTLSLPSAGATITTATGTGTINDNDVASANLAMGIASVTEGGNLVFTVTRSGNTASAVSVSWATAGGTATSGSDFTAGSGTLNFAASQTTATITVVTIDDTAVESAEAMTVTLSSPSAGATITTATGTGTINDNDVAPANLAIGAASVTEGGSLVFTVTRSGNTATAVSVNWATAGITATTGSDFTVGSGTLNFAASQTSKTITVVTIDDTAVESAETMMVALSSPSAGATITTATGTGTINDNDSGTANLAIGAASVTEGGTLVLTVTRSGNTTTAVSVNWGTAGGTATSGSDFTAGSGTLNFAAGQTTATITVATIDDTTVESAETMTVTLSSPSAGATITTAAGTGTINDNDTAPANLAIGTASVTEGGNLVFTVTRSGNTASAVSVNWGTAGGTATSGSDFTAGSGTLNFAANQTTATITVTTINDTVAEFNEAMTVTLVSPSSGAAITTATGTGTIVDNDVPWQSAIVPGTYQSCVSTCVTYQGYIQGLAGSMSNTSFGSYTVTGIYRTGTTVFITMSGSTAPPNSGWTSIVVPGLGTLNRSSMSYTTSGVSATWTLFSFSSITSGTISIY